MRFSRDIQPWRLTCNPRDAARRPSLECVAYWPAGAEDRAKGLSSGRLEVTNGSMAATFHADTDDADPLEWVLIPSDILKQAAASSGKRSDVHIAIGPESFTFYSAELRGDITVPRGAEREYTFPDLRRSLPSSERDTSGLRRIGLDAKFLAELQAASGAEGVELEIADNERTPTRVFPQKGAGMLESAWIMPRRAGLSGASDDWRSVAEIELAMIERSHDRKPCARCGEPIPAIWNECPSHAADGKAEAERVRAEGEAAQRAEGEACRASRGR